MGAALVVTVLAASCGEGDNSSSGIPASPESEESAPTGSDAGGNDGTGVTLVADGVVTDAAVAAAVTADGDADVGVVGAVVADVLALPPDEQLALLADLSRRAELELGRVSGLVEAAGGEAAAAAALDAAWAPVIDAVVVTSSAAAEAPATPTETSEPQGVRQTGTRRAPHGIRSHRSTHSVGGGAVTAAAAPNGLAGIGVFMGMLALGVTADSVVSAANDAKPGPPQSREISTGSTVTGSIGESTLSMQFDGTQDGVAVKFTASMVVHPCPAPDGSFDAEAKIDIKTSKGDVGSNATIDMRISGQVGEDAELVSSDATTNTQWADFAASKGQFIDFTADRRGAAPATFTTNRTGGTVTEAFVGIAAIMSGVFSAMVEKYVLEATEKAWKSGRCVDVKVTPSDGPEGLETSAVVSVLAEPRSKIDGQPTGGTVTATLTAGGQSVDPNSSPVPADAESTFTAPSEPDQSGTVAYEARSRRGIGRASVTFTTTRPAAFRIVGGLEDWQVDQVVCDVTEPFTLTSDIGTMTFSGGLSGDYSFSGVFNSRYTGTYQITLPTGPGQDGTMIGGGGGTIAGQAGAGSENYVLTPTTC